MRRQLLYILLLILPLSSAQALVIGTSQNNPPFSSASDEKGHFYGFDIDIMNEVCKRIKAPCTYKTLIFNEIFTELMSNKIDIAIAAIIITEDRSLYFLFSIPYLESNAQFITQKQSPINTPEDIKNKRIGIRQGTPFATVAHKIYGNQVSIIEFDEVSDLYDALKQDKIDVILTNDASARYWYANNSDLYKLIGTQIPTGEGYGIIANKGQEKLISRVNEALLHMEEDGTYLSIYTRYFQD